MSDENSGYGEFEWVNAVRARFNNGSDIAQGIGDDAALICVPEGKLLAVSMDTLAEGVHFHEQIAPADLGHRSLAVNLSDLAATGAKPAWATLSLTAPKLDREWCESFLDGFTKLARQHDVQLIGGDTTKGPLSITVQIGGYVSPADALRRSGAKPGDAIVITGNLGDAALALRQWREGRTPQPYLAQRFTRPTARVAAGLGMVGLASAAIDVSDGLISDLGHILEASNVGAALSVDLLPSSVPLRSLTTTVERWRLQLAGGDDYELCLCVPPDRVSRALAKLSDCEASGTVVGEITSGSELHLQDSGGAPIEVDLQGYRHF